MWQDSEVYIPFYLLSSAVFSNPENMFPDRYISVPSDSSSEKHISAVARVRLFLIRQGNLLLTLLLEMEHFAQELALQSLYSFTAAKGEEYCL